MVKQNPWIIAILILVVVDLVLSLLVFSNNPIHAGPEPNEEINVNLICWNPTYGPYSSMMLCAQGSGANLNRCQKCCSDENSNEDAEAICNQLCTEGHEITMCSCMDQFNTKAIWFPHIDCSITA
jgi:hypothetical protein